MVSRKTKLASVFNQAVLNCTAMTKALAGIRLNGIGHGYVEAADGQITCVKDSSFSEMNEQSVSL
ncbi:hypothetical protein MO867_16220 [Microbulbifer sp. OS29]|uniref:Uncharacterized protein n=1 Tax=Microbulbifer okhotskensis TaxID=2926617 RepID=A0A9X2EP87_9GAMM|nr:hypothetical protein [Microbulbifer okhotskensis]MCO1335882.1 hypothetical protein [Microbulbifer okhotskensis]